MKTSFPLVTLKRSRQYEFRDEFFRLLVGAKKELLLISPFIDSYLFEEVFRQYFGEKNGRSLTMISRPPDTNERKKQYRQIENALKSYKLRYELGRSNQFSWYFDRNLHAKILIADYKHILFGSQNFTYNGLGDDRRGASCNNELGALISAPDRSQVKKLKNFVSELIKDSTSKVSYQR